MCVCAGVGGGGGCAIVLCVLSYFPIISFWHGELIALLANCILYVYVRLSVVMILN